MMMLFIHIKLPLQNRVAHHIIYIYCPLVYLTHERIEYIHSQMAIYTWMRPLQYFITVLYSLVL